MNKIESKVEKFNRKRKINLDRKEYINKKRIIDMFNKYKMYLFCILVIVLSIISIVVQAVDRKNSMQVNSNEIRGKEEKIAVYITGAVKNPGVYYLEENSRLSELLDICGGIAENADIEQINLAKKLVDSDKITIPVKQEKSNESGEVSQFKDEEEYSEYEKVNINSASKEELMELSGIGESTAEKIIEYRKVQRFLEIEDIMNVSGIGKAKYDKIKDYIEAD